MAKTWAEERQEIYDNSSATEKAEVDAFAANTGEDKLEYYGTKENWEFLNDPDQSAVSNKAYGSTYAGATKKAAENLQQMTDIGSGFTKGLELELQGSKDFAEAAKGLVTARKTAPTQALSDLWQSRPGQDARSSAGLMIHEQKKAGEGIAEAEGQSAQASGDLGTLMAKQSEEKILMPGGPVAAAAESQSADWYSTWNSEADKIIDTNEHWHGDNEAQAYDLMMNLIDEKVVEIFGASFRGYTGSDMSDYIWGIASGKIQADPIKTAYAKWFRKAYLKADAKRKEEGMFG